MMKYELRINEFDHGLWDKTVFVEHLSKEVLENAFATRDYGTDVQEICIYIVLIKTQPGFERFFQPRRPQYIQHKESRILPFSDDKPLVWDKRFHIEIRFDGKVYDDFISADEDLAKHILARETLIALNLLDKLPKRLKDFDKEAFRADVKELYQSLGWLD